MSDQTQILQAIQEPDNFQRSLGDSIGVPRFRFSPLAESTPPFLPHWIPEMLLDPTIRSALNARNAAMAPATLEIVGPEPVKTFIQQLWKLLWTQNSARLCRTRDTGTACFLCHYERKNDQVQLTDIEQLPLSSLTAEHDVLNKFLGVRIHGKTFRRPRVLWLTYDAQYASFYGRSILEAAFIPWWDKVSRHGYSNIVRMRMMKDANLGDVMWFPARRLYDQETGQDLPMADWLREAQENRLAGGSLTLPLMLDDHGNKLLDYDPPTDTGNPIGIWNWGDRIDNAILQSLGVPAEVLHAAESGSGYAGRSVPLSILLGSATSELMQYFSAIYRDIIAPLVRLNFGYVEYSVIPRSLLDIYTDAVGGTAVAGSIGG